MITFYDNAAGAYFFPYDSIRIDGIFYSVDESVRNQVSEIEHLNSTIYHVLKSLNKGLADDLGIFELHVRKDELHVQWHTFKEYQKYSLAIQNAWKGMGRLRGKHHFLHSPEIISWGLDA